MKILIYSNYFFPILGGTQTIVFELASGLAEWAASHPPSGSFEVTVVTQTKGGTEQDRSWPFVLVRCPTLWRLLRLSHDADVIHIAGPALLPMTIGWILRKPVVIEHHGYQSVCPNGLLLLGTDGTVCPGHFMARHYRECVRCNSAEMGWLKSFRSLVLQFPRRLLCNLATSNVAITEHVAHKIALPRTRTIVHGIRDAGPSGISQNGDELRIGYVGRLVQEKGVPVLLKAAQRLKENRVPFHLTIVGGGPLRNELESESRDLGIGDLVTFTGDLSGPDLERAVRTLPIIVVPSLWEETAGLVAIEHMMRGGVVIASDIGGLSEIVTDAGLKFVPGDSGSLYARLREISTSPSLAASIGSSARARALESFGSSKMIESHLSLYREVAKQS